MSKLKSPKPMAWKPSAGLVLPKYRALWRGLVLLMPMWEGGGPPRDYSGRGNHSVLPADAADHPAWGVNEFGVALDFDGSDDYVDVLDTPDLKFPDDDFSFGGWFKHRGAFSDPIPFGKGGPNAVSPYFFWINSGVLQVWIGASGCAGWLSAGTMAFSPSVDTWYHAVFTKAGTAGILYVDGVQVDSDTLSSSAICDGNAPFRIGMDGTFPSGNFTGPIDGVVVYNRAIAAAEVALLFKSRFGIITEDEVVFGRAAAVGARPQGPLGHPLHGPFAGPVAA